MFLPTVLSHPLRAFRYTTAHVHRHTLSAPASKSAWAQAQAVLPVVRTSSNNKIRFPAGSPFPTAPM